MVSSQLAGYVDDDNLYTRFREGDLVCEETSISGLSCTLDDIKDWMMQNRLKMNDDKTEFIIFRGRQAMQKCNTNAIRVGDTNVYSSPCVKLMGMTWDRYISFTSHIPVKSNAASFALSNLNKIRMHLSKENALKLATALVFLHMDYCNSMFVGPQKETLKPYQRYQRQVLLTRV